MKKLKIDSRARGLIFDLDGTLADSMPVHYIAFKNILGKTGLDFSPELFISLAGIPAAEIINRVNQIYGTALDPEVTGALKEAEYERNMHLIRPIEPVVALVREYAGKMPMAVGTGGNSRLAWKTLEILGLKERLNIVVASGDVQHFKPHPETFLKCAEKMGVEPQFCQVFEDGKPGIEAALAAGMMVMDVTPFYTDTVGKNVG